MISASITLQISYICPECHTVFRPRLGESFSARHTPNTRRLLCGCLFLVVMISGYVAGLVFGLSLLGLSEIAPTYLVFISSVLVFVFGIFKAGSTVFSKNSYDIISSMPVKTSSVVIGRLASMYLEDLTPTLLIMPSGTVTFGIVEGCNIVFYILTVINNNNRIRIEEL